MSERPAAEKSHFSGKDQIRQYSPVAFSESDLFLKTLPSPRPNLKYGESGLYCSSNFRINDVFPSVLI